MNRDKEIRNQEALENTPLSEQDKELYTRLMDELEKEPSIDIKPSFSANIIQKIETKKRKEERLESILFASVIGGVLALVVLMIGFINTTVSESINVLDNSPILPAAVLITLLVVFQVLDKRFLIQTPIKKHLKEK